MENICTLSVSLLVLSGTPAALRQVFDWKQKAIDVVQVLGLSADSSRFHVDVVRSTTTVTVLGDVRVAFDKGTGDVFSVIDTQYQATRVRSGSGSRPYVRPGQGWKFRDDSDWDSYCGRYVQKLWPGTVLEPAHRVRKAGEQRGRGDTWSSDSNLVTVYWRTRPFNNLCRSVVVTVDQESGRLLSITRTRPAPVSG